MRTIYKQVLAELDIKNIWLYSFDNWGEAQADKYYDDLSKAMGLIAENSNIGIACDYIREGYRQLHVNHHIIFPDVTIYIF